MASNGFGRAWTLCALAVLAGTALSNGAAAQSTDQAPPVVAVAAEVPAKPTAEQKKQAKKDLAEGKKLLKKKEFDQALPKLQAAYAVDPKPATLKSIAQCERETKQLAEAYRSYERYAAEKKLGVAEKVAAVKALSELRELTGVLKITVAQSGAAVSLDQASVGAADLAAPIRVDPGKHFISAKMDGFEPFSTEVEAEAGKEAAVEIRLQPEIKTGHVIVAEQNGAPGLHVLVDGKDVGPAPWEGDLEPGKHVVELKGDKLASAPQPIDVAVKSRSEIKLVAAPVAGAKVHVAITTTPANAAITIDGQPAQAPFAADLEPGTHKLEISAPGYVALTQNLIVAQGQPVSQNIALVELPPEPSAVKVGALVGIVAIPRPIEAEIMGKFWNQLGVGVQYSMIPTITFPGKDAKIGLNAIQGTLRWFPFKGAFYLGTGVGYQALSASLKDTVTVGTVPGTMETSTELSSMFVSPQLGWLWTFDSGFALGLNAGVQIPFASDPTVETKINGIPFHAVPVGAMDPALATKVADNEKTVSDVSKLLGKIPFPNVDLLKIGFFF